MRAALRRRLLLAAQTDALAVLDDGIWSTRCLHCRSALQVRDDGEPLGLATLEHVIPQAWFGRRAAAALTAQVGDDADDPRNLALACARCNHDKGKGHDARGPGDVRAREVVKALLATRLSRWQDPTDAPER
ncbi:HNH endonuclease [Luteimonas fraxinea]|uniref:HNH endonuclease n=1 Tax=Luteimonas fraxinea TaxID=2901869 RepID=UPI001E59DCC8|nr:HNH endonuclease [Luteimonas fraxinea]MCD9124609.1 HNH endonuclease [Luteimonas fraxinea]